MKINLQEYCKDISNYQRFPTREVMVGDIPIGKDNPIRVQSMMSADLAINNYAGELDIILGNLFLLYGKLNDISGDRSTAIKYYKLCRDLDNFSYASKQSREYLKKPYLLK